MLKVNDVVVNFKDPNNVYAKRVNDCLKKLEALNKTENIVLEFTELHSRRDLEDKGKVIYATSVMMPFNETIINVDGDAENWTYYERVDTRITPNGKADIHIPKRWEFQGHDVFPRGYDKGKLFFLVFISSRCEHIKGLDGLQNPKTGQKSFRVLLPEQQNQVSIEWLRKKSAAENKILNELKEDKIRSVAKAMGAKGVDGMGFATVTNWLTMHATANEDTIRQFNELCNDTPIASIKAVVSESIEKRVIDILIVGRGKKWAYVDVVRQKPDANNTLCSIPAGLEARDVIDDYMVENPDDFEVLEKKLKKAKEI